MGILEKQMALAIDKRIAVFKANIGNGSILQDEMQLHMVSYIICEIVRPCCCMLCNKDKLKGILAATPTCRDNEAVQIKLATMVYDDLARCNGLG